MTLSTHARRGRTHVTGAASAAVRPVLESQRRPARVLAVFPAGIYLEVRTDLEPSVIAVVTGEGTRLPNSVLLASELPHVTVGDEAAVGDGLIELGRLSLRARRWWDPAPPLGRVELSALTGVEGHLAIPVRQAAQNPAQNPARPGAPGSWPRPGLEGNGAVEMLAGACARGGCSAR